MEPWKAFRVKHTVFVKSAKIHKFSDNLAWHTHFSINAGAMTNNKKTTKIIPLVGLCLYFGGIWIKTVEIYSEAAKSH